MAAPRYANVRERVMQAVRKRLEGIRRSEGYNMDVRHVYRVLHSPAPVDPPEIYMYTGQEYPTTAWDKGSDGRTRYRVPCEFHFFVEGEEFEQETYVNLLASDIRRALATNTVFENFGPRATEIHVDFRSTRPFHTEVFSPRAHGRIQADIEYWSLNSDDRRWDDTDEIVEIEATR